MTPSESRRGPAPLIEDILAIEETVDYLRVEPSTGGTTHRQLGDTCAKIDGAWRFSRKALEALFVKSRGFAGMPILTAIVYHPVPTTRSGYRYMFTPKHHGAEKNAAQWLPILTLEEEFVVFNTADGLGLADTQGNLYGVQRIGDDDLRVLGTRGEQVAKFPATDPNQHWQGYPAWPLAGSNRGGDDMKPSKAVSDEMMEADLITKRGRKRLGKGDPV
jgi:hypothetical protein